MKDLSTKHSTKSKPQSTSDSTEDGRSDSNVSMHTDSGSLGDEDLGPKSLSELEEMVNMLEQETPIIRDPFPSSNKSMRTMPS
ncbi:hypothetical protein BDQ17DRAFT_1414444, partial [Cyathus striatus]